MAGSEGSDVNRVAALAMLAILVAAGWAAAQDTDPDTPTSVKESPCWTCHQPGGKGGGDALVQMFQLHLDPPPTLAEGHEFRFGVIVNNTWTAQLERVVGVLDISRAPSLAYAARPPPVLDQVVSGSLPPADDDLFADERSSRVAFETPAGGTDMRLVVVPDTTTGADAPDLAVRVWRPGTPTDGPPDTTLDEAGAGGSERLELSADPVPFGEWTLEVVQEGWFASPLDRSRLADQSFTATWDVWFNVSESDPVRTLSFDVMLDGQDEDAPRNVSIGWPVFLVRDLPAPETVRVRVELDANYEHAGQVGAVDRQRFFREASFTLTPPPANTTAPPAVIEDPPEEEPEDVVVVEPETGLDDLAEIVGYVTALLILWSMLSGGAFGKWTKRVQDWVARSRRRRRLHHIVTGYGVLLGAVAHIVLFVIETRYPWTVGWLFGGAATAALLLLAVTGMYERRLVARIGPEGWRWLHWGLAVAVVALTALHLAFDGIHFKDFQAETGWEDPLRQWLDGLGETEPSTV